MQIDEEAELKPETVHFDSLDAGDVFTIEEEPDPNTDDDDDSEGPIYYMKLATLPMKRKPGVRYSAKDEKANAVSLNDGYLKYVSAKAGILHYARATLKPGLPA